MRTRPAVRLRVSTSMLRCTRRYFRNLGTFHNGSNGMHVFHVRRGTGHVRDSYHNVGVTRLPVRGFRRTMVGIIGLGRHFVPPCRANTSLCVHPMLFNAAPLINMGPSGSCRFIMFMAPMNPCFGNNFRTAPFVLDHGCSHTTPLKANGLGINNGCTTNVATAMRDRSVNCSTMFCLSPGRGGCVSRYNTTGFFTVGNGACIAPVSGSVLPSVAGVDLHALTRSLNVAIRHHPVTTRRLTAFSRTNTYNATTIVSPVTGVISISGSVACALSGSNGPKPGYAVLCGGLHTVRCNRRTSGFN